MQLQSYVPRVAWGIVAAIWAFAVAGAAWCTTSYEFSTDNQVRMNSAKWPSTPTLVPAKDRPTLLVFVHPRCPCTRSTLHELMRLLGTRRISSAQQPNILVVATLPKDAGKDWRETDVMQLASQLPRSRVVWDVDGRESRCFQVRTSGFVILYDADGEQLFAGGVTVSRGHEGASTGGNRLRSLLSQEVSVPLESTPAFGCRLCLGGDPSSNERRSTEAENSML